MSRLRVHCCCKPELFLGWLDVPDAKAREGTRLIFAQAKSVSFVAGGARLVVEPSRPEPPEKLEVEEVVLEVSRLNVGGGVGWILAVKSNDTPIEILRRIPGFTEAR